MVATPNLTDGTTEIRPEIAIGAMSLEIISIMAMVALTCVSVKRIGPVSSAKAGTQSRSIEITLAFRARFSEIPKARTMIKVIVLVAPCKAESVSSLVSLVLASRIRSLVLGPPTMRNQPMQENKIAHRFTMMVVRSVRRRDGA